LTQVEILAKVIRDSMPLALKPAVDTGTRQKNARIIIGLRE
jgi:hypothetical protein